MQTFSKEERLRGRKTIGLLFDRGSSYSQFPFRVSWMLSDSEQPFPAQVGVVVPKRHFKKASDRNRLKRRMREAFRRNKQPFYEELRKREADVKLMIVYTAREALDYRDIERKIIVTLQRLLKEYDAGKGRIGEAQKSAQQGSR